MKDYTNTSKKNIISALRDKGVDISDDVEWYELDDKIEQIEIATGARHDWNENDPTKPGYIENRPFYTGDPVETVFVEESTVSFVEQEGLYIAEFRSNFVPTVGEAYKVSWDGTVYECTCVDFSGNTLIGNLSIAGVGSDTGEPFVVGVDPMSVYNGEAGDRSVYNGGRITIGTLDTSASHTISISGFVAEVVKIDEKYLPDDLTSKISTLSSDVSTLSSEVSIKMDNISPTGNGSFSLNRKANTTIGANSFAEGYRTTASGENSHAEGYQTTASGENSHAEGDQTTASGEDSHAEGYKTTASKNHCHAEGWFTTASGSYSHAEGCQTTASGNESHAEGGNTTASGNNSHAEGKQANASGSYSHAESYQTTASGQCSHAEGYQTTASGKYSHAEGFQTTASSNYQHVQGRYNVEDSSDTYANIVGNGNDINARSNAHTLDWEGNAWYSGTIEGKALILPSSTAGSTKKFKITVDDSGTITATEIGASS